MTKTPENQEYKYYIVTIEEKNGEQQYTVPRALEPQSGEATLDEVEAYAVDHILKCWYGEFDGDTESYTQGYTDLESYDDKYNIAYFTNGCSASIRHIEGVTKDEWIVLGRYL